MIPGAVQSAITRARKQAEADYTMIDVKSGDDIYQIPLSAKLKGFGIGSTPPRTTQGAGAQIKQQSFSATEWANSNPADWVEAIRMAESNGNQNAISPKGAISSMQVLPSTAASPGYGVTPASSADLDEVDRLGKEYFLALSKKFGSPVHGAMAYNMGPGAFERWMSAGADTSKLPAETRTYVNKVMGNYHTMQQSQQGGTQANQQLSPQFSPQGAAPVTQTPFTQNSGVPFGAPAQRQAVAPSLEYLAGLPKSNNAEKQFDRQANEEMRKRMDAYIKGAENANAALEDVHRMRQLAEDEWGATRKLSALAPGVVSRFSDEASEYGKLHANVTGQIGAAFGATTDASRATASNMLPDYGAPLGAQRRGLEVLENQLEAKKLKAQILSVAYTAADPRVFTSIESILNTHAYPEMMPHIKQLMNPSSEQNAAAAYSRLSATPSGKQVLQVLSGMGFIQQPQGLIQQPQGPANSQRPVAQASPPSGGGWSIVK